MTSPPRPYVNWVVYERPREYPDQFVARKYLVFPGDGAACVTMTDDVLAAGTLEQLRALMPHGLQVYTRLPGDHVGIVENWVKS